ncbi:GNAT family N-acetyltransferase [Acidovorax facilis]|uniref:GNAT family N-acetyltransferase n=1 Tax=Acidovorax facilis TaxID=12917 RepID=UPI003CFA82FB
MSADTEILLNLQTRPSLPEDAPFLQALFAANCTHLGALGLPPAALAALIDQQYGFRRADYQRRFPQARTLIALSSQTPVGQMVVNDDGTTLHIVDIAVVPSARGCGYGSALVRQIQSQARTARREAVTLSVDPMNQVALRLYGALGFEAIEKHPVQWRMVWRPAPCFGTQGASADTLSIFTTTKG